jgi:hypothetical protein
MTTWLKPEEPNAAQPKMELALDRDEIYSTPNSGQKTPGQAPPSEPPPSVAGEPQTDVPPPPPAPAPVVPAGPPGLLIASRRKNARERLMAHPVIWPAVGAVASLLAGLAIAVWLSGSMLESDVKPLATERAILLQTPAAQRDTARIGKLDGRIDDARSSVAWKTAGLWSVVFAAGLFTWSRVFRD